MAANDPMSRIALPTIDPSTTIMVDFRTARLPSIRPPMDDFDPRDYRNPSKPIKVWMAYFNMIRTGLGAGVLGLPLATSQAGMVLGPLMIVGTGMLVLYTHFTLLWCLNEISRQLRIPRISYRYGFRIALLRGPSILQCIGHRGPTIIAVLMILSQLGICTVFVIFTADSLRDIMDWNSSNTAMLALIIPYVLLEYFMTNSKVLSMTAIIGLLLNLTGMALVFYHILKCPHGEVVSMATDALPLLFAFGTCLFNFSALGVALSLDRGLQHPKVMVKRCGGVLVVGIMLPTVICTVVGSLGYWSFGTMEENILRALPFDEPSALAAIGIYLIAVALAYPIQCHPAIQVVLDVIGHIDDEGVLALSDKTLHRIEMIANPMFVCLTFLISYLAPFQGPFVAFVGSLCTTLLCLVFPALMELSLKYPDNFGWCKVHLIKNLLLVMIGMFQFVMGVYMCGMLLYVRIIHVSFAFMTDVL